MGGGTNRDFHGEVKCTTQAHKFVALACAARVGDFYGNLSIIHCGEGVGESNTRVTWACVIMLLPAVLGEGGGSDAGTRWRMADDHESRLPRGST